ncbi:MAG: CesT family type III secretion system chaperone [Chlamydiota bacterium]|nr:CesT family type III secretion system chaperone [Chlamydiota bacterium]
MESRFAHIIQCLGEAFDSCLEVDEEGCCTFLTEESLEIQLSPDRLEENLIMVAFVQVLYPGPFRERVLEAVLRENNHPNFSPIFSYIESTNTLVLHHQLPFEGIGEEECADALDILFDEALQWKLAIESVSPFPQRQSTL